MIGINSSGFLAVRVRKGKFSSCSLIALVLLVAGCAGSLVKQTGQQGSADARSIEPVSAAVESTKPVPNDLVPLAERRGRLEKLVKNDAPRTEHRYSFHAVGVPIDDALRLFARDNNLNLVLDLGLDGNITADFTNLNLEQALDALLDAHDYAWEIDKGLIRVRRQITRSFDVDYLRLRRLSEARNESGSFGVSEGGSEESGGANEFAIEQENDIDFWEELTEELAALVGEDGLVVANRTAGFVTVTSSKRTLERVEDYLQKVRHGSMRQVSLEAKIVEVELDDTQNLGIDWAAPNLLNIGRYQIGRTAFGSDGVETFLTASVDGEVTAILEALQLQGNLNVVSQPRLKVVNNQTAQIRVARDEPYYVQTQAFVPAAGDDPAQPAQFEQQSATIGLVVQVTPNVAADGWITLEIAPVITRKLSQIGFPESDQAGNLAFTGDVGPPVIDVKQTSAVVRVRSGETAIIGGLIQESDEEEVTKVPLFGDLPLVGAAFRDTTTTRSKTELVIMITPVAEYIETDNRGYAW